MRKMFTKLFGLTLLMYLVSSFAVAQAQDCDLTLSESDVVLLTDITTVCDSDLIQYAVTGFPAGSYYSFNGVGDTTAAGFTPDSTFWVKEGVGFVVQVKYNGTCFTNILTYPSENLIEPVYIDTLLVTQPLCADDEGELTVVVGGTESFLVNFVDSATQWTGPSGTYPLYNGSQFQAEPGKKYYVRVHSANGCTSLGWDSITVNNAPAALELADVLVNGMRTDTTICVGDSAMVTVEGIAGGTAPYYVTLSDGQMDTLAMAGDATFYVTMPGSYTATVLDTFGCKIVSDSTAVLVGPEPISFKISLDDVSCADSATGAIYIHDLMGGTTSTVYEGKLVGADTTMDWTAASMDTITFEGLAPGYYSVWVRDDACTLDSVAYENPNGTGNVISVQAPGEIELTVVVDPAECTEGTSVITASATGGNNSYEYQLDSAGVLTGWGTTSEWTVPDATANYVVWVRDAVASSCEIAWPVISLEVLDTVAIVSIDSIAPTCPGGNDGVIKVNATGPDGATLWYSLDGTSWKTNNQFLVFAGDYTVYVRDAACENDVEMMDVSVPALDPNTISIDVLDSVNECAGTNDNTFYVQLGPWANQAGEHRTISVYYSTDMADIYVNTPDSLDFVDHGGPGVRFGGDVNLDAGTYYFWAIDNFGCVADNDVDGTGDYVMVTILENDPLAVSGSVTDDASCYGEYDGVITVKGEGGEGPYKYGYANTLQAAMAMSTAAMTDWPVDADSVQIQVGKGTYYVVGYDTYCDKRAYAGPFVVDGLDMVTITDTAMSVTDIVCAGDSTGVIEVFPAMGGTNEFEYTLQVWEEGAWVDVEEYTDVDFTLYTGLPWGTYQVVVTDLGGCDGTTTGSIDVDGPTEEVVISSSDYYPLSCAGSGDGLIEIWANGGTAPYQFKVGTNNWRNFPEGSDYKAIVVTEAGEYEVWVRDSKGCTSESETFIIEEPEAVDFEVTVTDVTNTCDADNGTLEIDNVTGGSAIDYTVYVNGVEEAWHWGAGSFPLNLTDLSAGEYVIKVVSNHGYGMIDTCFAVQTVNIYAPDTVTAVAEVTDHVLCNGDSTGVIVISDMDGGTVADDYTVTISPDLGTMSATDATVTFSDLPAGTYSVTVADDQGCTYTINGIEIEEPVALTLNATHIADITCTEDGKFSVQVTGGMPGYSYYTAKSDPTTGHVLLPDLPGSETVWQEEDSILSVSEAGTWIVWAKDANGCIIGGEEDDLGNEVNEWRVQIEDAETAVDFDLVQTEDVSCNGDMNAEVVIENITIGGSSVELDDVTITVNGVVVDSDTIKNLGADTVVVVITDIATGCDTEKSIIITEPDVLDVTLELGDGEFSCPDVVEGYIEATATGGFEMSAPDMVAEKSASGDMPYTGYMYQLWQDGVLKTDYQPENSFLVKINHSYVVVVKDYNGCTDTSNVITIDPVQAVELVNIMDVTCSSDTLASVKVTATADGDRQVYVKWTQFEAESGVYTDSTALMDQGEIVISQMFQFDNENVEDIHYEFQVIDEMGCKSDVDTMTFDQIITSPLEVTVTEGAVSGCGTEVTITAAGGVAPYVVMVNDEEVTEDMVVLGGGMHTIKVMDAHECMVSEDITLDYPMSMDTALVTYTGEAVQFVYEEAMLDTMLMVGEYSFYYAVDTTCTAELNVTVTEKDRTMPVLDTVTPMDTIADNHPTFQIVFEGPVTFNDSVMGYLTVTEKDSSDAVLTIEITPAMVSGNTITVDYTVAEGESGLDKNTTYVVAVDSGIVMGDGLAWDGVTGDWMFTTGPEFATGIPTELVGVDFKVYPNPFNSFIRIDNADKLDRVVVTNIAGQRVLDIENPTYEIRTGNLVTGVYVVTLISSDEIVKSERIIKR